ncbi:MAG: hypothetical protein CMD14_09170 [Flavobacteriales bacterium]|nr:hypothetical protein [Flavobacteriales bacterium]|tara:strand:+ start:25824 stop:26654 length:831 start_codon:yes stop_codon:yes gene_type:complete
MALYKLKNVYIGNVVKRPSKTSKTPYVADIIIENDTTNTEYMAHTAALGCCGMVDSGKQVIMIDSPNPKNVCKYKIMLAKTIERGKSNIVGVDPNIAEDLVEECIKQNLISSLIDVKKYKRQQTLSNSRFDFIGLDSNNTCFILEVKNVPLADYVDCYEKERKKMDFSNRDINSKIAYFPDGYRKKQKDTVSPRALKHITELTNIKLEKKDKIRCIMCYVIQRRDVCSFQASNVDPIYKDAFNKAVESGVEVIPLQIGWDENGNAEFICDDLPINM